MSSCFGRYFRLSLFGQSHGPGVGVTLDGFPAGLEIDMEDVARQMARRAPGQSALTTPRKESDLPEILSGVFRGKTTGQPLTCLIRNENTRSQDYGEQVDLPRPGHGDYTGHVRYYGFEDFRGGGHFSARLTAPLVFAGALCRQYLAGQGISAVCHIQQLENILDKSFLDPVEPGDTPAEALPTLTLPTLRPELAPQMEAAILAARAEQDSVGGVLECRIDGLPAGLGAPLFRQRGERALPADVQHSRGEGHCLRGGVRALRPCGAARPTTPSAWRRAGWSPRGTTAAASWGASPRGAA